MGFIKLDGHWIRKNLKSESDSSEEEVEVPGPSNVGVEDQPVLEPAEFLDMETFETTAEPMSYSEIPSFSTPPPPPDFTSEMLTGMFNQFSESITGQVSSLLERMQLSFETKMEERMNNIQQGIQSTLNKFENELNAMQSKIEGQAVLNEEVKNVIDTRLQLSEKLLDDRLKLFHRDLQDTQSRLDYLEKAEDRHCGYSTDLTELRCDFARMKAASKEFITLQGIELNNIHAGTEKLREELNTTWMFLKKLTKTLSNHKFSASSSSQPPPAPVPRQPSPPPSQPIRRPFPKYGDRPGASRTIPEQYHGTSCKKPAPDPEIKSEEED